MKLNLGCGDKKIYGFVNVDVRQEVNPDVVCDLSKVSERFNNLNVELIYASHVLEHFPLKPSSFYKTTCIDLLHDWHYALSPGGILRLAVPDFEAVCKYYLCKADMKPLKSFLHGGQKHDFDFHLSSWDFTTLKEALESVGFKNVKRYDWRKTEHGFIDDYSQAYLPHMDKVNGTLMSLNVEAEKC